MRLFIKYLACFVLCSAQFQSYSQQSDSISLSLNEAIEIAQRQSLNAFIAKNTYLEGYWDFRTYRADLYPSLNINSELFNYYSGNFWVEADQEFDYRINTSNSIGLSLRQNIVPTGGVISLNSEFDRFHNISNPDPVNGAMNYKTRPLSIRIDQPLTGYNRFKWIKKLKPLEYEIVRRNYIRDQQDIAQRTVSAFFDLAKAEVDLTIANFNFSNADTLYRIGKGRFEIGTITQDELLNLELTWLNAEKNLTTSRLNLQRSQTELNSFLRFPADKAVVCSLPEDIPELMIEADSAVNLAYKNNPQLLDYKRSLIQQDQNVALQKSRRFDANLQLSYGVDQVAYEVDDIYAPPYSSSNGANIRFNMPLIDWGKTKSNYLMAESSREITKYRVEQGIIDFEKNVINTILEFNLQRKQLEIANKAQMVGQLGFDVTKQRFLIGKVDVIRLNEARNGMVNSKKSYIQTLESYWNYIYYIQKLTLFDFLNNVELQADYENLIKDRNF